MRKFAIITDSFCELNSALRKEYGIDFVPGHIVLSDKRDERLNLEWDVISREKFYRELNKNPDSFKCSPANQMEILEKFRIYARQETDILAITISSASSGSFNSFMQAKHIIQDEYPDLNILVVDSLKYGPALGLMCITSSMMRQQGKSLEETYTYLEKNKFCFRQSGWLEDLYFVAKKGRITNFQAFRGTMAKAKTMAQLNREGTVTVVGTILKRRRPLDILADYIKQTAVEINRQTILLAHSQRPDAARELEKLISEQFNPARIIVTELFPGCGMNMGSGLVCAYFFGKEIPIDMKTEKELVNRILHSHREPKTKTADCLKIDGQEFYQMLLGGFKVLTSNENLLNQINVFPVPDGDTGTNLKLTVSKGLQQKSSSKHFGLVCENIKKGLLLGSHGNSGNILSQIFNGLYIQLQASPYATSMDLLKGFQKGYETANASICHPMEGTMLSVIRDSLNEIRSGISETTTIQTFFTKFCKSLKRNLKKTPKVLIVLKKNRVVDSGALGFLNIMTGMKKVIQGKMKIQFQEQKGSKESATNKYEMGKPFFSNGTDSLFCLEILINLPNLENNDEQQLVSNLKTNLSTMGSSVICFSDNSQLKIHIHTDKPEKVLSKCSIYGPFIHLKVEPINDERETSQNQVPTNILRYTTL